MNKKLISLAVAAAVAAPLAASAETTLYGRLDTNLVYVDGDELVYNSDGEPTVVDVDNEWDVQTETTRLGVKGSEDLGNGLKAIFQAEWAFNSSEGGSTSDPDLKNRLAYAGLSGSWGTAAIGRQWTPYYGAVDKTDIFGNSAYNAYYVGTFRTGNAISYVTPSFSGFKAAGAVVVDAGGDDIDAYNLAAMYDNGPISLGVGYHKTKEEAGTGSEDYEVWGIAGSYAFGSMAKIIAQYENGSAPVPWMPAEDFDLESWAIAGEYYMGNHTFRALYGNLDYDADDSDNWAIGWQYNFSKRTLTYVEYGEPAGASRDNGDGTTTVGDGDVLTFGLKHFF